MAENNPTPAAETVVTTPATPANQAAKPEDIAAALIAALDARTQRAERGVAKSFAEQYGMTDAEIGAILEKAKAEKAKAIPADVQERIDAREKAINDRIIAAEIKAKGAAMGLVDADVALQLIDRKDIKIGENDAVTGVDEALEALQESKPYLFGAVASKDLSVGAKIEPGSAAKMDGVEAAFRAKNPGLKF